jgi:hypothetical protein
MSKPSSKDAIAGNASIGLEDLLNKKAATTGEK